MRKTRHQKFAFYYKNFAGIYFCEFSINSQNSQKFIPVKIYTNKKKEKKLLS